MPFRSPTIGLVYFSLLLAYNDFLMQESEKRRRAEKFIRLEKQYTVLPPDDVNLPSYLFEKRMERKLGNSSGEFIYQVERLLEQALISSYFKKHLVFESKLEAATGWTRWGEMQEELLKDLLGISLKNNMYGIFDPDRALEVELRYFLKVLPLLKLKEAEGLDSGGVSWREWGEDLMRRDSGER